MNHRKQKNLTDHIRSVLHDHHEPYVLGSWERFNRHKLAREKVRRNRWLRKVAAIFLVVSAGLFVWFPEAEKSSPQIADLRPVTPSQQHSATADDHLPLPGVEISSELNKEKGFTESLEIDLADGTIADDHTDDITYHIPDVNIPLPGYQKVTSFGFMENHRLYALANARKRISEEGLGEWGSSLPPVSRNNEQDFLAETTSILSESAGIDSIRYVPKKNRDSFTFGLAYMPFMNIHESQALPGMGGGISAGWQLSDKISLTSGLLVAQNHLKYDIEHGSLMQTFLSSENATTTSTTSGEINHIRVDLLSLEVPLGIRYSFDKRFFLSAGISSVTFFRERYGYEFEFEQQIQVFTDMGDRIESTTKTVRFTETHQQSEPSFQAVDWAAFYTFSLGYRFDVAERHMLSIEPFLKIPNQQVASRDIRYTTGGMQVTLSF